MSSEGPTEAKQQKLDGGDANESKEEANDQEYKALEAIGAIRNEINKLNEQAREEIREIEQKYNKLKKQFFEKRNAIIESIPNFWVKTFINHPQISAVVDEEEEQCLQYLNKLEVDEDHRSGYKLSFTFKSNPYFSNEVLCKEFDLTDTVSGDAESKSTKIEWKDGMDLMKREGARKNKKRRRMQRGFFTWFLDNTEPDTDDIAETIKDDMWPNPLQYYLLDDSDVENGMGDSSDEEEDLDESVVVVEDDDEDEEVYEVEDDDDELDTTGDVEVIEEDELDADDGLIEEINDSKDNDKDAPKDDADKDKDDNVEGKGEESASKEVDESKEGETGPV